MLACKIASTIKSTSGCRFLFDQLLYYSFCIVVLFLVVRGMVRTRFSRYSRTSFVALFSFIMGSMLTINFMPVDKTCVIQNTDKEYNIMQNSKFKSPDLIIIILSSSDNFDRRLTIRNTWINLGETYDFKHYFVIGTSALNEEELSQATSEQATFNDMLLLPLNDSYSNLTQKLLKTFEWLTEQSDFGLDYKYALKCDDDSFVNLGELLKQLQKLKTTLSTSNLLYPRNLSPEKLNHFITVNLQSNMDTIDMGKLNLYWGYFDGRAHVQTTGKWRESNWIFCDKYMPYALGGGYILSKALIEFIGTNADHLRTFQSEDISVGLWLAPVTNIMRVHDMRFDTEWSSRGCKNYQLIRHHISIKEMQLMYKNLVEYKQLCTKETQKRDYWMYNWSMPASHCCKVEKGQSIT